jgi:hypothetical protein
MDSWQEREEERRNWGLHYWGAPIPDHWTRIYQAMQRLNRDEPGYEFLMQRLFEEDPRRAEMAGLGLERRMLTASHGNHSMGTLS